MLRERHFTQSLATDGPGSRRVLQHPQRPSTAPEGERTLLSSASGRIKHVFMVATRRLPGFEQGMLERLLRLAGAFPRISLAVHAADSAEMRARIDGLGLTAAIDVIAAPEGAALWPWAQDRLTVIRGG